MRILVSLFIGGLFGAGLAISGMMNPAKVIGFLDVTGPWDPTLAVVMVAALVVSAPAFALVRIREKSLLGGPFQIPRRTDVDWRLVAGGLVFGLGWGIAGFCPGPAIAALSTGMWQVGVFFVAMVAGMALYAVTLERR